jgi:hypothetical protein
MKKWANKFEKCIDCGTNEIKHHSKGRCYKCFSRHRYKTNPEYRKKLKILTARWRKEHPEQALEIQIRATNNWRKNHSEAYRKTVNESFRRYYAKNKEEIQARRAKNKLTV